MHMYNALFFLQHTYTKKLISLSGYCVPSVKCCMFLVSRIMGCHEAHFQGILDFGGAKMPQNGLKMGSFHPFVHPKWSRMSFEKQRF